MPGRARLGAGLFDQQLVDEKVDLAGPHNPGGDLGGGRFPDETAEALAARPQEGVEEEAAVISRRMPPLLQISSSSRSSVSPKRRKAGGLSPA